MKAGEAGASGKMLNYLDPEGVDGGRMIATSNAGGDSLVSRIYSFLSSSRGDPPPCRLSSRKVRVLLPSPTRPPAPFYSRIMNRDRRGIATAGRPNSSIVFVVVATCLTPRAVNKRNDVLRREVFAVTLGYRSTGKSGTLWEFLTRRQKIRE